MNRRALVTGAGIRVGRAIALELARSGFDVAVHYNGSEGPAREVASLCREQGVDAFTLQADLATVEGCRRLVAGVLDRWDTLDVLVNNASIFEPVPFADITDDAWEHMLAVNLRAPFLLSRDLLPALAATGDGVVVHLCDVGADRPVSGYAHYSVSKAGLAMLIKAMAVELAPAVRTVGVSPGQVAWPESYPEEKRERIRRRIPLQRVGAPDDIARLVRFLVTEGAYINGENVAVDGGLSQRY